jgi:hypothetical protein
MDALLRRRPSPTFVVASLAVLVALTGTGIAAVRVAIPAGSVGTAQLAANAVTSNKVKNGSLLAVDVKKGQTGKRGAAGPAGPAGAAGAAGAAGSAGPIGPTDAYFRTLAGPIAVPTSATTLTTLSVPAGKYVIVAKGSFSGPGGGLPIVSCVLAAGGDFDRTDSVVPSIAGIPLTFMNTVVHEFAAAGTVTYQCGAGAPAIKAGFISITAIKVASLTNTG